MVEIYISHHYDPATKRAGYVVLLKAGKHSKTLMKSFRICNESRIVFWGICEGLDAIDESKRSGIKVKLFVTHHPAFKIIKNRYIFRWASTGFREAGKESHPDLFKRFVRLTEDFKHVRISKMPIDADRVMQCKANTMDIENLFEDEFWEKHHGMILNQ